VIEGVTALTGSTTATNGNVEMLTPVRLVCRDCHAMKMKPVLKPITSLLKRGSRCWEKTGLMDLLNEHNRWS